VAQKEKRTAGEVLDHHIKALNACQVDDVVYDYAPDAVIITQEGVVKGLNAIREFFINSTNNVLPLGSVSKMAAKIVEGEVAFIVWTAESPNFSFLFGTDTFIIRKGEIVEQTFAGLIKEKGAQS
jgi:ketosteroid isomerase-like protein